MPQCLRHGLINVCAPLAVTPIVVMPFALKGALLSGLTLAETIIPALGIHRRCQVARHILAESIESACCLPATAAARLKAINKGWRVTFGLHQFARALAPANQQRKPSKHKHS